MKIALQTLLIGATIVACAAGFGDCNDAVPDGCETPLTSLEDCGECGVACDPPGTAIADCSGARSP